MFVQGVVDVWSYAADALPIQYGVLTVVVIGLLEHSHGPGVFTKDKSEKAKSGKYMPAAVGVLLPVKVCDVLQYCNSPDTTAN